MSEGDTGSIRTAADTPGGLWTAPRLTRLALNAALLASTLTVAAGVSIGCGGSGDSGDSGTCVESETPRSLLESCRADCEASRQVCGDGVFMEDYDSVSDCTNECVSIANSYAADVTNSASCVDAQARFIDCCSCSDQCGGIPDNCDPEFDGAAAACGGSFGGCPSIFF